MWLNFKPLNTWPTINFRLDLTCYFGLTAVNCMTCTEDSAPSDTAILVFTFAQELCLLHRAGRASSPGSARPAAQWEGCWLTVSIFKPLNGLCSLALPTNIYGHLHSEDTQALGSRWASQGPVWGQGPWLVCTATCSANIFQEPWAPPTLHRASRQSPATGKSLEIHPPNKIFNHIYPKSANTTAKDSNGELLSSTRDSDIEGKVDPNTQGERSSVGAVVPPHSLPAALGCPNPCAPPAPKNSLLFQPTISKTTKFLFCPEIGERGVTDKEEATFS